MTIAPPTPPFAAEHQLSRDLDDGPARRHVLPSHPNVSLGDRSQLRDLLTSEFCSDDLDRVADKLWWMSKQDSGNISPLHRQLVKRRKIVITEDPKLHLVWIHDRIFVKPLPGYLTSHAFWTDYLAGEDAERIRRAALGYLRTYVHLLRHESDFRIAQDAALCLVSREVTWEQFCAFASQLRHVRDRDVSSRYAYGEIRLTRLNFYAPFLLGKSHFQRVDYQYGDYFSRFFTPVVFVFAIVSVILGALQVVVSVGDNASSGSARTALFISVAAILVACCLLVTLGFLLAYKIAKEWRYALRDRRRRGKGEGEQV
ncbi:hypothetical protein MAC_00447 [Metarhizium acridum CQMa 102]|uniref:Subtilisin-like serine protease n=1 Tax=Metarhizium acridum (strain CQMa 102) TaxID=655827 RepID=E9DS49_METAQ|nr:uncharacterized protein MAC_00447 [Metarhizium acridum CQMa 102]EFY93209.1 hypothetical protein MAC_00447 [Metarhizium acridum CQMa 102]